VIFGSGEYRYRVVEEWARLPDGWEWGVIPAVACDSRDRVFVGSRSSHPLLVFDRDGNFLDSWGEDVLVSLHGLYIDAEDNVYATMHNSHCIYKFNREGKLVMTLGVPGKAAEKDGEPFNKPTNVAVASNGELFVSDGYVNARVHRYSPDGELLLSWGDHGNGPGQFDTCHCVRLDNQDRVWVCDLNNRRIQRFDVYGKYLGEWSGLKRPNSIHIDSEENAVYVAEQEQQVSIYTLDGELITKWGGGEKSDKPGEFRAWPHGIWADSRGDLYVSEVMTEGRLQKFVRQ
jgi:sugar lactone lactonase YvrE